MTEGSSKKSYGNLKRSESGINLFEKSAPQAKKEKEDNIVFNSTLQFLPDEDIDEENLLKEKDDFITTDQDVHILDNASLIKIQIFSQSNPDINYILDVMSSVLINNKTIPFRYLKDCFGYDFKEIIKKNLNQETTKEKLENFNKNLLIRNIQYLNAMKYRNTTELKQKQPMDLLKILLELNKQKYPNQSTLEHLRNTLNSTICVPELEIDFLIDILPNINVPYDELNKCIKTRYNNQFVKSQVSAEKLGELNKQLLIKNILEIQESVVKDKNKQLDYEALTLLSNKELMLIKDGLYNRKKVKEEQTFNKSNEKHKKEEVNKTELISSIQQLSQHITDTEFELIKNIVNVDKDNCCNVAVLGQLNADILAQINTNLLVYNFINMEYYRFLINENCDFLSLYNILLYSNKELKRDTIAKQTIK